MSPVISVCEVTARCLTYSTGTTNELKPTCMLQHVRTSGITQLITSVLSRLAKEQKYNVLFLVYG